MLFFSKAFSTGLVCFTFWYSGLANAGTATEELADILEEMVSLRGSFTQQTYSVEGELLQSYSGGFKLKRPGFFYWHVQAPGQQLLVSDGTQVWDYDVDLEQLIHNKISGGDVYDFPMQIISGGIKAIRAHYRVELADGQGNFVLLPLTSGGGFTQLRLAFDGRILAGMEMLDAFGQRTEISFANVELNPALADSLFKLLAPAGVDVISNVPAYSDPSIDQVGND